MMLGSAGQFFGFFLVLGLALIFWAFRLYIIQSRRRGEGSGSVEPASAGGGVVGHVGVQCGEQESGRQGQGGGGFDGCGVGQAAAIARQKEGGAADSDQASGGGIAAGDSAQVIKNSADSGNHAGETRLQVVDVNVRAAVPVVKPRCYARTIRTKRGHWRVSGESLRACLVACSTAADVRQKSSWTAAVTGGLRALLADGKSERGALDAPELIASGGAAWSPGGGVPMTIKRGGAK